VLNEYRHGLWAVDRRTLGAVHRLLATDPGRLSEAAAKAGQIEERAEPNIEGGIAVIPLRGVVTPRASLLTVLMGGTPLSSVVAQFRAAVASSDVTAIVFDVDSPGGRSSLVEEFATEIRDARGAKPILAVANTFAASAAYWIASAADEVVVTPSGHVGSIGAYILHEDWSGFNERMGVDPSYVYAGKYKVEGNLDEPLEDEARAELQRSVDECYQSFVESVAAGRGVEVQEVIDDYGEGRVLSAARAVEAGLADRVATLDEVVAGLLGETAAAGEEDERSAPGSEVREIPVAAGTTETRTVEIRDAVTTAADDGPIHLQGYAAVFDSESEDLGGFIETFKRGAFKTVLDQGADVRLLVNHAGVPMARTKSGTLTLEERPKGLWFDAELPDTQQARDLATSIGRGDIDQMSFRFRAEKDGQKWSSPASGPLRREVTEVRRLPEISVVTFPAYPETEADVRSEICGVAVKDTDGALDASAITGLLGQIAAGAVAATADDRIELARALELATAAPSADDESGDDDYGLTTRRHRLSLSEREFAAPAQT
jgi:HK97 family phage prohead protease